MITIYFPTEWSFGRCKAWLRQTDYTGWSLFQWPYYSQAYARVIINMKLV